MIQSVEASKKKIEMDRLWKRGKITKWKLHNPPKLLISCEMGALKHFIPMDIII